MTHVNLEVSDDTYNEIRRLLKAAGYDHAFGQDGTIDMHGIGLVKQQVVVNMKITADVDSFRRSVRQIKESL
jgi:virulence-associated protein VapD